MLCKACREDLPELKFAPRVYRAAIINALTPFCFECGKLSRQQQKAKAKKCVRAYILSLQPITSPKERDEWSGLSMDAKRASLKKDRTHSEKLLEGQLLVHRIPFDIQVPVGPFFVDFRILPGKLAVEVDGAYHFTPDQAQKDAQRTGQLRNMGWRVIRFTNEQVKKEPEVVIKAIRAAASGRRNAMLKANDERFVKWTSYVPPEEGDVTFTPNDWVEALERDQTELPAPYSSPNHNL